MTTSHPHAGSAGTPPWDRQIVKALVQTGSTETVYRRAGQGPTLVLLLGPRSADERDRLLSSLARAFRVIDPTPPEDVGDGWSSWLRGVVDGLGLQRPALVADPGTASRAEALARSDPHRFGPVIVVQPGSDPDAIAREIGTRIAPGKEPGGRP